jgi:hypothetical protein
MLKVRNNKVESLGYSNRLSIQLVLVYMIDNYWLMVHSRNMFNMVREMILPSIN